MIFHVIIHLIEVGVIVFLLGSVHALAATVLQLYKQVEDDAEKMESISVISNTLRQVAATVNQRFGSRSRAVKTEQEKDTDKKV